MQKRGKVRERAIATDAPDTVAGAGVRGLERSGGRVELLTPVPVVPRPPLVREFDRAGHCCDEYGDPLLYIYFII